VVSLARLNNRTHRELLVVDGRVAFIGGAGIADWWASPGRRRTRRKPWRDTMARVEGR
jgi:cardiolipin synthase A/B